METSDDFVRAIRSRYHIESDYAVAKLLGLTRSTMSAHKTGVAKAFSDSTGIRIAELLDLNPTYVLVCLNAERAKRPDVRAVWQRLADATRSAAAAVLLGVLVSSGILSPGPARADVDLHQYTLCEVATRIRRALARWRRSRAARYTGGATTARMRHMLGRIAALLSLSLTIPAHAADAWSRDDTAWQATYLILHGADWAQTRYIASHPDDYHETNPILGAHPSVAEVNQWFIACAAAHTVIAAALPARWRRVFQQGTVAVEFGYVAHNVQVGVGMRF